jgi:general secretion pathway protein B
MSLILEALRKSEAERRRGQSPGLHAELPPVPARRVPAAAAWWAAAGALLLLAVATWWVLRETPTPSRSAASQPQRNAPATAGEPQPQSLPARTSSAATRTRTSVPTRSAEASERGADAPDAPSIAAPPAARPSTPTNPDASAARREVPAPALPAMVPDASAPASPNGGRALSLAELDPGTRGALPPLKLSMHLWNPDPAQRFVILDGQRLGEGDRAGDASIVRIERDGVLLEWHGRGIRVPVR